MTKRPSGIRVEKVGSKPRGPSTRKGLHPLDRFGFGTAKDRRTWFTGRVEYEGLPLYLRYPGLLSGASLSREFPILLVVTLHLSKVRSNGLPDPDYNDSLREFDLGICSAFWRIAAGLAVLVETFAGRRIWYSYVSSNADIDEVLGPTSADSPNHKLEWKTKEDSKWNLIRRYAADFQLRSHPK